MAKDMKIEEQRLFGMIDSMNFSDAELALGVLPEINQGPHLADEEETASLARIKARTLARLEPEAAVHTVRSFARRSRRRNIFAAAAAVILIAAGMLAFSPEVQAGLRKALSFLPGFGTVVENSPGDRIYVLGKPYDIALGDGSLTVDAVLLQELGGSITLRGRKVPEVSEFEANIGGNRYTFTSYMRSSSESEWYGSYSSTQPLQLKKDNLLTLHLVGTTVGPLQLTAPKTAEELGELGASDIQQDVRITAFPVDLGGGLVRVQLLPTLTAESGLTVHAYGLEPLVPGSGLYIENAAGEKAALEQPESMSYPSDFRFHETAGAGAWPYTVFIPYIEVSDHDAVSAEVEIPLPDIGQEQMLHTRAEIAGFPVEFTRIERTGETAASVDVNVNFNAAKLRTLKHFLIRYPGQADNSSFSWVNMDQTYGVMKTLHLETKPGEDKLRFKLSEPHFLLKGPWRLPLKLDS
ncbi:hypothetical protein NST99_02025 [Paenibacillus sp. FSL L8-0470]|uniref:hypothetical protein n=1 Tax=Paenibacillus sp. FSL L8-0470 TaxID=2954688 RepID=UPI0030F74142